MASVSPSQTDTTPEEVPLVGVQERSLLTVEVQEREETHGGADVLAKISTFPRI